MVILSFSDAEEDDVELELGALLTMPGTAGFQCPVLHSKACGWE